MNSSALNDLRTQMRQATHADEEQAVAGLLETISATAKSRASSLQQARGWVVSCREQGAKHNLLDAFLGEFSLSNPEGIALMCLAEALLRIPDAHVADALIDEKLSSAKWSSHFQKSESSLVNAATIGLILTGGFTSLDDKFSANPLTWLEALGKRLGEPVVRQAIRQAMGLMGKQYVLGRNIEEATKIGKKGAREGTRFSFDMLGEGARTQAAAKQYMQAYQAAIDAIGSNAQQAMRDAEIVNDGISVKISALHPRYHSAHAKTLKLELFPRLKKLALAAKNYQIGFTIDAEESERLDISLDFFAALAEDKDLAGWQGLGLVVQAYQKRAPYVLRWLAALARATDRKFMVRLVKGAYWDREIKFAQELSFADYPVFTRKENTDLSYRVCAEILLGDADVLYPQFATHNAMTIAAVLESAEGVKYPFEFQRLHGMGELLYDELLATKELAEVPLRVYAPVGEHKDLLPYLVRRLLENGANSSFVNQFLDKDVPVDSLIRDPIAEVAGNKPYRHPKIPLPKDLFRASGLEKIERPNSSGMDLDNPLAVEALYQGFDQNRPQSISADPIIDGQVCPSSHKEENMSPVTGERIGDWSASDEQQISQALDSAKTVQHDWDRLAGSARAQILRRAAQLLEARREHFIYLITREAGRTVVDALDEIREAVDFCNYYAAQAQANFSQPQPMPGPTGEDNSLSLHGRGVFLCISPWNFPLAIFVGQISAALAAGNCVIAKPAEQTPAIAAEMVALFHQAGIPGQVLHLLLGEGAAIGNVLLPDPRIDGVCFTGSTEVAKIINRQLAEREGAIVPLIAETGGLNAMIVDSSALAEQVIDDVLASAFGSAGQRCSALRVLYLQEEIADATLEMLIGAIDVMEIDDPLLLSTDVGPVIDKDALAQLERHIEKMDQSDFAKRVTQFDSRRLPKAGYFMSPTVFEIDSIARLEREVFGPVLHVVRYNAERLDSVLAEINHTGYGLTLGVHSRREGFAAQIFNNSHVGNTYINRNVVGAVVGVQPFGGRGLSGTGPKAGGPHYLQRFATEKTRSINVVATGGNVSLLNLG